MRTIKILLSALVLLVILIFFIVPPVIGIGVKAECNRIISQLNRTYPNITASISHYRFGWFQSKINLRIDIHLQNGKTKQEIGSTNTRLFAYLTVRQGPFIIRKQRGHYNTYLALADMDLKSPELHLRGHSIWHLTFWASAQFMSPSFEIISTPFSLYVKNLQGMLSFHLRLDHYKIQTTIGSLKIAPLNKQMKPTQPIIAVNQLLYKTDLQKKGFIRLGQQKFFLKTLMIHLSKENAITLSNINASSNTQLTDSKINITNNYNIQSITQNKFDIKGLHLNFSIEDLDEEHFNHLLKLLSENKLQLTQYPSFVRPGLALLRQGLNINLKQLTLQTPSGTVSLTGILQMPKLSKDATLMDVPIMMKANFYLQAPKEWLTKQLTAFYAYRSSKQTAPTTTAPEQMANDILQNWEQQQLIISTGNQYKTHIQFQEGRLLFNGRPAILPTLPGTPTSP